MPQFVELLKYYATYNSFDAIKPHIFDVMPKKG